MRITTVKELTSLSNEAARQANHYRSRNESVSSMWFGVYQAATDALARGDELIIEGISNTPIPIIKACEQQAERRNPGDGQ